MKSLFIACLLGSFILLVGGCGGNGSEETSTQALVNPPPVAGAEENASVDTAAATFGVNLIRNGGFELNTGGNGNTVITPLRWNTYGNNMTVVKYGAPGGFPTLTSPGPVNRGLNFLAGGPNANDQSLLQIVKVGWAANDIDAGKVRLVAEAFLGGYGSQDDHVRLTLVMRNVNAFEISAQPFKFVKAGDRKQRTGLLKRVCRAAVPPTTRRIDVWALFVRTSGTYSDGYLDNVSMRLEKIKP